MAATLGSRGQLITLPSFNNVASSNRQIDTGMESIIMCCALWLHGIPQRRHQLQRDVTLWQPIGERERNAGL